MKRLLFCFLWLMVLLPFAGCGGGGDKVISTTGSTGRASVKLEWPQVTRLIPVSSNSVKITVTKNGTKVAEQTLPRPVLGGTSNANFTDIPVGSVVFTATAYPTQDGSGTAQATASVTKNIVSGENEAVSITMATTVTYFSVTSDATTSLLVGNTLPLIATARDNQNNVVLTSVTRRNWVSDNPSIATVDSSGVVTGISAGFATIRVTDTESGATGSTVIGVTGTASPGTDPDVRAIGLTANAILYDRVSQKIYASIPSSVGVGGNTVQIIDPVTGTRGASVFVGSEPNRMGISDDGQYLYVGLDGAGAIRRVTLSTFTADQQFVLNSDPNTASKTAGDIAVQPGHPNVVVVSLGTQSYSGSQGLVVFDNGVARSRTVANYYGAASSIVFGTDPSPLFGYTANGGNGNLLRYSIDETGVALLDSSSIFPSGVYAGEVFYDNNRLYSTSGGIVNATTRTLIGTIAAGLLVPDSGLNRIFDLSVNQPYQSVYGVRAYDLNTFVEIDHKALPGYNPKGRLIRWGAKGLAFLTTDNQLVLITTAPGT